MKKNILRSSEVCFRKHQAPVLALLLCALFAPLVAPVAQIMPGFRAPSDLVDGASMAVTSACYLASAGRPVPGINEPANGFAGEGVTEQKSAPEWVAKVSGAPRRARYSTLKTPEGEVWIRHDEASSHCSVIVRPADVGKFRSAVGDSIVKGSSDYKRELAADGSESIIKTAPGFAWTTRVSTPTSAPDVVLIETDFARR